MKNIYIKAMEIGFENPEGIVYSDFRNKLANYLGNSLSPDTEYSLLEWVINSFNTTDIRLDRIQFELSQALAFIKKGQQVDIRYQSAYKKIESALFVIKGQTIKQYIDYLELKESRENSKKAFMTSIISIGIAVLTAIISIYLTAKPSEMFLTPIDVRVIDDQTVVPKLEEEIDYLNDQLYKAEILIELYEEENFKE